MNSTAQTANAAIQIPTFHFMTLEPSSGGMGMRLNSPREAFRLARR